MTELPATPPGGVRAPEVPFESLLGDGAENAEVGLFIYDDDGRYVAVNRYGAELLGYDRSELLIHDVGDFAEGWIDRTVRLLRESREGVRIVRRSDGSEIPVAFIVIPTWVSSVAFYLAVVWELAPDDTRIKIASTERPF